MHRPLNVKGTPLMIRIFHSAEKRIGSQAVMGDRADHHHAPTPRLRSLGLPMSPSSFSSRTSLSPLLVPDILFLLLSLGTSLGFPLLKLLSGRAEVEGILPCFISGIVVGDLADGDVDGGGAGFDGAPTELVRLVGIGD